MANLAAISIVCLQTLESFSREARETNFARPGLAGDFDSENSARVRSASLSVGGLPPTPCVGGGWLKPMPKELSLVEGAIEWRIGGSLVFSLAAEGR